VRHIYVCDNGSTDRSTEIALNYGARVLKESDRGYGAACLVGVTTILNLPKSQQPEVIGFIDGDYSDRPQELILLINALQSQNLDLVIGSRVLGNPEKGSLTIPQKFGNRLITLLLFWKFKYQFTDLGPFRLIRIDALKKMNMQDRGYGWTIEMQIKAMQLNFRIGEVAVSYHKRIGTSKISGTVKGAIGAGSKILFMIFKSFFKG
jgi:glycosyltransferase involved in cell wall biosynthesis